MNDAQQRLEPAKVVGPEEGESYWQPVPANGFIRNIFSQASIGSRSDVSVGTQTVPPGCFIREHTHAKNEEIIYVIEGRGVARIDGVEQALEKGSAVFVGMNRKHHFLNPHAEPMTFVWVMSPGGLERSRATTKNRERHCGLLAMAIPVSARGARARRKRPSGNSGR
jgi:quercetin dioxygenase-like cupin family protein